MDSRLPQFNDHFYRSRARSQPPEVYREHRHRPSPSFDHKYRDEYRSTEYERPGYRSDPSLLSSDDDEDDFDDLSDYEVRRGMYEQRRPHYSSRMKRNTSTPNIRAEYDDFLDSRGRSRSRGPVNGERSFIDPNTEHYFSYQPRSSHNFNRGREEIQEDFYEVYDEPPSRRLRSRSRGRVLDSLSDEEDIYGRPFYEERLPRRHSYESPPHGIPFFEGRQLRIESEEQVHSQRYETGTYVRHWEEPIKFRAYDELLKPVEWQAKLEIMEAQVLDHSSFRDFPRHIRPLELNRFFIHLADADRVIHKVVLNLKRMREANYCTETFSLMVIDQQRPNVACLVGVSLNSIIRFSDRLSSLLLGEGEISLHRACSFLRICYDFLSAIGLDMSAFKDSYGHHSVDGVWYSYARSRDAVLSAIMYATRAIGYMLDIATVSFCGAHLEPFDEVYFDRTSPTGRYRLPCDAHGAAINIQPRNFQCLEGFLQGRPVWVFGSTEGDDSEFFVDEPMYLSTTPAEFANLWGPMWRSASPRDHEITLRYMVSPGFIIPWRRRRGEPALLPNEVHCHWTKDSYDFDSILAQTIHGRIERLLIGAHSTLLENRACRPNKQDFYNKMSRKNVLKELGFQHGSLTTGPYNVSVAVGTSNLLPVGITTTLGTTITKKPQKSLRDLLCTASIADPRDVVVPYLDIYCGVEISACTGHARRIRFAKVLGSQTIQEYLQYRVPWSSVERLDYFRALQDPNSKAAVDTLYRQGSESQKKNYDQALKLSMAALFETRVKSGHLRALWALKGMGYIVSFKLSEHKWAGLLTDSLTTCSLVIVNQTCLECSNRATRHYPEVPVGKPTVFETSLVINPEGRLPTSLEILRRDSTRLSEAQINRRLKEGDMFDIKDHGRVRVLRTPFDARVFVELVKTYVPARRQTIKNFFRKARGKDQLETFHREYKDNARDQDQSWFFLFVVSDHWQPGPWR